MNDILFRPEVAEHRRKRLYGEVVLKQPLSLWVVTLAMGTIAAAVALWLVLGTFARIEAVPGVLVTVAPSAKVITPAPGIISHLRVSEGTTVRRGQRLAIVTLDRRGETGGGIASDGLHAVRDRMAMTKAQVALVNSRLIDERARLQSTLDAAQDEARRANAQIALQREAVESNEKLFEQIEAVVERGFVSRLEYERRRQALLASRQSLGELEQRHAAAVARAVQSRAQIRIVASEGATQVGDLMSGQLALRQQEAQLRGEQAYALVAPVDGVVTALQIAEGRTATPGATLLTVVPSGSELRAEVYAPSRAIGLVRPGQETRLLFDAFPYQRFGSFPGRVRSVSRIAIDPRENEALVQSKEPVYRVVVGLDRQHVDAFGTPVPLQPGMTLTANIVLERQSFLAWLLMPLRAVLNRTQ